MRGEGRGVGISFSASAIVVCLLEDDQSMIFVFEPAELHAMHD
jgi:hypothetical protein